MRVPTFRVSTSRVPSMRVPTPRARERRVSARARELCRLVRRVLRPRTSVFPPRARERPRAVRTLRGWAAFRPKASRGRRTSRPRSTTRTSIVARGARRTSVSPRRLRPVPCRSRQPPTATPVAGRNLRSRRDRRRGPGAFAGWNAGNDASGWASPMENVVGVFVSPGRSMRRRPPPRTPKPRGRRCHPPSGQRHRRERHPRRRPRRHPKRHPLVGSDRRGGGHPRRPRDPNARRRRRRGSFSARVWVRAGRRAWSGAERSGGPRTRGDRRVPVARRRGVPGT